MSKWFKNHAKAGQVLETVGGVALVVLAAPLLILGAGCGGTPDNVPNSYLNGLNLQGMSASFSCPANPSAGTAAFTSPVNSGTITNLSLNINDTGWNPPGGTTGAAAFQGLSGAVISLPWSPTTFPANNAVSYSYPTCAEGAACVGPTTGTGMDVNNGVTPAATNVTATVSFTAANGTAVTCAGVQGTCTMGSGNTYSYSDLYTTWSAQCSFAIAANAQGCTNMAAACAGQQSSGSTTTTPTGTPTGTPPSSGSDPVNAYRDTTPLPGYKTWRQGKNPNDDYGTSPSGRSVAAPAIAI